MNASLAKKCLSVAMPLCVASISIPTLSAQIVQSAMPVASKPILSLVHDETPAVDAVGHRETAGALKGAPENFRQFSAVRAGETGQIERLTLQFSEATTLTSIQSTKDFPLESGGSCTAGKSLAKNDTCSLFVRFEPKGAGRRLGTVTVEHTAAAKPEAFGIGGYGYSPILSFTPSTITTVPGTYPSNAGLLNGASNLTVDGSDKLYIADTNNGTIRSLDSSGTFTTLGSAGGYPGVYGIAVDTFGEVFWDVTSTNAIYEDFDYGAIGQLGGSATDSCQASTPCVLTSETLYSPGEMSMDSANNMFYVEGYNGAALSTVQPYPASLIHLYDPFTFQNTANGTMAVDANDNLYSAWEISSVCQILQQALYNAENNSSIFTKIAGGRNCGFSGDGGQAGNAQIGSAIAQITFDAAGNLYFSDTSNQRVRRIDYATGQISTIAGNGTKGYAGDGGVATSASLNTPTGVAVDSRGQVYIISSAASGQVIRKVGTTGALNLGSVVVGATSATQTVTLSNTGNSGLNFTRVAFSSGTEFTTDPNATTCNYSAPLPAGRSCKIGFIFKPTATGTRTAVLSITDDTVNGLNTIQLTGTGASTPVAKLSVTSIAFPSTKTGSSSTSPVTVTNSGSGTLTVSGITNTGTSATQFTHTSNCGGNPLASGASCTIQVIFAPTAAGTYTATLNIADNATNSPQTVALTATGTNTQVNTPTKPKQPIVTNLK